MGLLGKVKMAWPPSRFCRAGNILFTYLGEYTEDTVGSDSSASGRPLICLTREEKKMFNEPIPCIPLSTKWGLGQNYHFVKLDFFKLKRVNLSDLVLCIWS